MSQKPSAPRLRAILQSRGFGRLLIFTLITSTAAAISLSSAIYSGLLGDFLAQPANQMYVQEFAFLQPKEQLREAPPQSPLGQINSQINPFLLGVIGEAEPQSTKALTFDREHVLGDVENRIDKQFEVTDTLKDRVGFWFDVYSKYDSFHRIIHNQRYPWIIYKVVDVTAIINSDTPRVRWLRNVKADNTVKAEQARIKKSIERIAKGTKLNDADKAIAEILRPLGKDVRKVARAALGDIRVQTGQRDFFMGGLAESPRYLPAMERIFRAKKLPIELTRLPFVESSFNQHATSKVGASGIWQFMNGTGRKFLIVNGKIDERRSPFKASEAAAALLKENHMILSKSWPLALTAWNHGPAGVRKACKAAGSKDLGTVVSRYHSKSFDFASSNFYSEFLGALYSERYSDLIFGKVDRESELQPLVVRVQRAVRVRDVIKSSGLSKEEFLLLNPDLESALASNTYLPVGFRLHLPDRSRVSVERLVSTPRFAQAD